MIKEAIDSYYVRMVLTYDGIDNFLTYKDDHQEVKYGYEAGVTFLGNGLTA